MPRFRFLMILSVLGASWSWSAFAAPRAVIVVGLAAGETQSTRLQAHAETLREGFLARGLPASAITVLGASGDRVRRDAVLAALSPASPGIDETWLVLLGTSAARGGEPSFQVSGPRLSATDLTAAVKALPGRAFVVVATPASGGFLPPLLALPGVEAVAATADSGEINEPRFAEAWAESLVATPQASFAELADSAAKRVDTFYTSQSLAQGEHARLIDRASGRIIEAPFSKAADPAPSPAARPSGPTPGFAVADIEIPKPDEDTEITRLPANEETLALLAEARDAAKGSDYAALYLRRDLEVTVGGDFSVIERHRQRAFLRTGESLDELGTLNLPSSPPFYTTRLEGVRIIKPDGSQVLVNPRSYDERRTEDNKEADDARAKDRPAGPPAPPFLPLPEVTAGCIVEAAWSVERRSSTSIPEFSDQWHLAETYPVRLLNLSITTPADTRWTTFAPNLPAATVTSTPETRIASWSLADLPAFEPRAGDPPQSLFTPWVGVSSLASWDAFAAWYQRIAAGSDTTGPGVDALVADIAGAHPDRAGRLRAAVERVSALRYVAIELGVGAFRPRTPEQVWKQRYGDCKDKANLLVAVLGKLGIPAEFCLVNRFGHTFTDWPSWQFNHAVARVPADPASDQPLDLWLDTTDRLVPFGVVAPGDLGRHALAFSRDFCKAAFHEITAAQEPASVWKELWTPGSEDRATVLLGAEGAAAVDLRHLFLNLSPAQRARRLQSLYPDNEFTVVRVEVGDAFDLAAPFVVKAEVGLTRGQLPPPLSVPGLASFFATETISRPVAWDEGRATRFVHARGTFELPAGPISPEAYGELRARWLDFSR
jgi:transglutaminase-like putative cysteine protease